MDKNAQVRWDDVTIVLAVIDQGSVAAAARSLGINHATVLRRIADFETRTGVRLFDKTTRGYTVSPDRREVIEAMRHAAEALGGIERLMESARPHLADGIRITTTDTLAQFVLPEVLPTFTKDTGNAVEVLVDNAHIDLSRLQAHLTVRPTLSLPPELDGVRVGQVRFGVYAARKGTSKHWLGLTGSLARTHAARWVQKKEGAPIAYGDSFMALAAMAASGLGRTVLPVYVGDAWPGLTCVDLPEALTPVPVWVSAHVDFVRMSRIKRARARLAAALAETPALSE